MASRGQAQTQPKPSKQKIDDSTVMQMARDAEEASRKQMAAKKIAFKKAEAEKIQKAEQEKKDAETKEAEDRKKSIDTKTVDAKAEADIAAEKKLAKEKRPKDKTFRKNHPTKLRVKLPRIDSYEKELEYNPDVPGRVVVSLERLMGTDRVRITDTKYLKTLLTQLEAEEQVIWSKRAKQWKLAERSRFRQWAIEGHMEIEPDLHDIFLQPFIRQLVNRILNRLSKLETEINHSPTKKLPPITPVEPFEEYSRTVKLFDFHPGHYLQMQTVYKAEKGGQSRSRAMTAAPAESQEDVEFYKKLEAAKKANEEGAEGTLSPVPGTAAVTTADQYKSDEWGGEDYWEEEELEDTLEDEEEEAEEEDEGLTDACAVELLGRGSLTDAKQQYGISPSEDLLTAWMPYRSELIDKVYDYDVVLFGNSLETENKENENEIDDEIKLEGENEIEKAEEIEAKLKLEEYRKLIYLPHRFSEAGLELGPLQIDSMSSFYCKAKAVSTLWNPGHNCTRHPTVFALHQNISLNSAIVNMGLDKLAGGWSGYHSQFKCLLELMNSEVGCSLRDPWQPPDDFVGSQIMEQYEEVMAGFHSEDFKKLTELRTYDSNFCSHHGGRKNNWAIYVTHFTDLQAQLNKHLNLKKQMTCNAENCGKKLDCVLSKVPKILVFGKKDRYDFEEETKIPLILKLKTLQKTYKFYLYVVAFISPGHVKSFVIKADKDGLYGQQISNERVIAECRIKLSTISILGQNVLFYGRL